MSIEKLQKFGLTDKEARVYLALLEIGDSVVTDIAKQAKVNRSTAYVLINSLLHHGLISVSERRGVKIFSAIAPNKLNEIAQLKYSEANELMKISKELVDDLKKLKKSNVSTSKTKVNVFEGKEGVKAVNQILNMVNSSVSAMISSKDGKFGPIERINSKAKIILNDSPATRNYLRDLKISQRHEIFLSTEMNDEYSVIAHDSKVDFISSDGETSFVIENVAFATAVADLHNMALHRAKKWNVKEAAEKVETSKDEVLVKAQKRFLGAA